MHSRDSIDRDLVYRTGADRDSGVVGSAYGIARAIAQTRRLSSRDIVEHQFAAHTTGRCGWGADYHTWTPRVRWFADPRERSERQGILLDWRRRTKMVGRTRRRFPRGS